MYPHHGRLAEIFTRINPASTELISNSGLSFLGITVGEMSFNVTVPYPVDSER